MSDNLMLVQRGWEAAFKGDLETVAGILAENVRWHAVDDDGGGCQNREQALGWMRMALEGAANARILESRELADGRVLTLLQREDGADPHGQVVTVRDGRIAEIVVYPTAAEALSLLED